MEIQKGVPAEWELFSEHYSEKSGVFLFVGKTDVGKSYLITFLIDRWSKKKRVAFIDGDIGQSHIGPPTTLVLASFKDGLLENVLRYFVGSISPRGHELEVLFGLHKLLLSAKSKSFEKILINTTGFISDGGLKLKFFKISMIKPDYLIAIVQEDELDPLTVPIWKRGYPKLIILRKPKGAGIKTRQERTLHRDKLFYAYFYSRKTHLIEETQFPVWNFKSDILENTLVSFDDKEGFSISLGIYKGKENGKFVIETPLLNLLSVWEIRFGSFVLNI